MIYRIIFSLVLLCCFSIPVHIDIASASQKKTEDIIPHDPQKITGKVTEVISAAGFTYVAVDNGKEQVWAAGPGNIALKKGDTVAFTTEMPMHNFHSKTLDRDFPLIYFVKQYISDKGTPFIIMPHGQVDTQQTDIPGSNARSATRGTLRKGDYLREATLDGLNGKQKKLSDFKGKPLIINVWASWCGPCRAEMESLENLSQKYNGKEFNVIGISTDDYRSSAVSFIAQTGISFENYLDSGLILEDMLGADTIPLTVLVDEHGRVLEKVRGARQWDSPEIIDAIAEMFHISSTRQAAP